MARTHRVHPIKTVAQLRGIETPVRQQIIAVLELHGDTPVRELAEHLGCMPSSLYYHLGVLERARLVEVQQRPGRTRPETVYRLVARMIEIDPVSQSPAFLAALGRTYAAFLRLAVRHVSAALETRRSVRRGSRQDLRVRQYNLRLTPARQRELNQRLDELEAWLRDPAFTNEGRRFSFTLAMSPAPATRGPQD